MKRRIAFTIGLCLALPLLAAAGILAAADSTETEPNDTPVTANALLPNDTMTAAIDPAGDQDYFAIPGVNPTWGFIALLDTSASTTSHDGRLRAIGADGATVLQSDLGSWEHGSGIALQNYADGDATHYLRVNEQGNDATISDYNLRYYQTIVATQPEIEPNNSYSNGTPSSFTESGVISPTADVDCFAFHGRNDDSILLALNGDPEGDGGPFDPILQLVDPSGSVLKSANVTGKGGKEFLKYNGLPGEGKYAYCVKAGAGAGGPTATYIVGLVRNGNLYFPGFTDDATWLNPRPGYYAQPGDTLSFSLAITNTSPVYIPGDIRITTSYSTTCLELVSVSPPATDSSPGYISWDGQKTGLAPGEVYSVRKDLRALTPCSDRIYQDSGLEYYFTGVADFLYYDIYKTNYLPLVRRR
jgi:hypothetical protein